MLVRRPVTGFVTGLLVLVHSYSHFVLLLETNKISLSCDSDVGDVGEEEHEKRVDKTLDNEEHEVFRIVLKFLPLFMRCRD